MATKNDAASLSGATKELAELKNKQKKEQKIVTSLEKKLAKATNPADQSKYATELASAKKTVSSTQSKIDTQQEKVNKLSTQSLTEEQKKVLEARQQKTAENTKAEQEAAQANDPDKDSAKKEETNEAQEDNNSSSIIKPGIIDPQGIETTYNPHKDEQIATSDKAKQELAKYTDTCTDVFYLDVKVFLEGVQIPHAQVGVSYGITNPASCTVTLPAHAFLRLLPGTTKILIVFRDLVPDAEGKVKYRVLFDGELSSISYGIDPTGAYITLSGIHSTAYLTSMQLLFQDVKNFLMCSDYAMLGSSVTMQTVAGFNKAQVKILGEIFKEKRSNIKSMADVVYLLVRFFLEHSKGTPSESSASKWYYSKLGNTPGGHKILQRIYGVDDVAKTVALNDFDNSYEGDGGNGGGNDNVSPLNISSDKGAVEEKIFSYLHDIIGMSYGGAAGFCGNIMQECSFNPSSTYKEADGALSVGICQWNKGRREALLSVAKQRGTSWEDLDTQLQHLSNELAESQYAKMLENLRTTPNSINGAAEAARLVDRVFERSDGKARETRADNAVAIFKKHFYVTTEVSKEVKDANNFEHAIDSIFKMYKGTPYKQPPNNPSTFDCQSWCHWVMECCGYTEFKGCGNNDEIFRVACEKDLIKCSYYGLDYMKKVNSDENLSSYDKYASYLDKFNLKSKVVSDKDREPNEYQAHLDDGTGGYTDDIKGLLATAEVGDIILVHNGKDVRGHSGVYRGYYAGDGSGNKKHWWYVASSEHGITEQSLEDAKYLLRVESIIKVGSKMEQAWAATKKD